MKGKKLARRLDALLAEESNQPKRWMYLSFADDDNGGFLGGVIIEGHGLISARLSLTFYGIKSPGGQVIGFDLADEILPPVKYRNRLLTAKEIKEFWPDAKTIREHEADKVN